MALSSNPADWNPQVNSDMQWHLGQAQALCPHLDHCKGPNVSNLGNVESGFIAISACRQQCAHAIRSSIPGSIVFPEDPTVPEFKPENVPEIEEPSVVSTVDPEA